jgi:hypothetical protein
MAISRQAAVVAAVLPRVLHTNGWTLRWALTVSCRITGSDNADDHASGWQHNAACPLGGRIWSSTIPCSLQCGNGANDRVSRPKSLTPVAQAHLDSTMDTPCFMGRDLTLCKKFATAWYGSSLKRTDVVYTFNLFSSWLC